MSDRSLGVGLLGAGAVARTAYLPVLAGLAEQFHVAAVMDEDGQLATEVADRTGARSTSSLADLVADPAVEVIAIGTSPEQRLAEIEACCAAGKLGIVCELPLADSPAAAEAIAGVLCAAGVPIVAGGGRAYDPGWTAAIDLLDGRIGEATAVRSTIVATAEPGDDESVTGSVGHLVLELSRPDLPLIRTFAPEPAAVEHAEFVAPSGGLISLRAGGRSVDLVALRRPVWRPDHRVEVWAPEWSLRLDVPPAHAPVGSAVAVLREAGGERWLGPFARGGPEEQWLELRALVRQARAPRRSLADLVADVALATSIAESASVASGSAFA